MTVTIEHDARVAERYPAHRTLALRIAAAGGALPLRPEAEDELRARFGAEGGDAAARRSAEHWRGVFDTMGAKPKYKSSVGGLLDLVERTGGELPIPIALVRAYCWFSLVHGVPMAGYRPERIAGPLRLTIPGKGVPFTPLGQAKGSREATKANEVAYVDDEKAICRYWNMRDCDETKLVEGIGDALFILDVTEDLDQDATHLAAAFTSLFGEGADVRRAVLGADAPAVTLDGG
ncbi:MAG TPA: hypothetical protein VF529_06925 [Solirubrobacteraceae bacterium]